jgi:beta-galactosidase
VNVNDGNWHHVAGMYDGAEMRLYVDGKLDTAKPASGRILTNESPVFIGANAEKPGRCFNGLIADVRVYNYALNADEIAAVADKGTGLKQ